MSEGLAAQLEALLRVCEELEARAMEEAPFPELAAAAAQLADAEDAETLAERVIASLLAAKVHCGAASRRAFACSRSAPHTKSKQQNPLACALEILRAAGGRLEMEALKAALATRLGLEPAKAVPVIYQLVGKQLVAIDRTNPLAHVVTCELA